MSEPSDQKILEFFKAVFATYDKNSDGTIDTNELGTVLKALGKVVSEEKLTELIEEFDFDHNGKIDWTNGEFLLVIAAIDVADVNLVDDLVFSAAFRTFDQVRVLINYQVIYKVHITGCQWYNNPTRDAHCCWAVPANGAEGSGQLCRGPHQQDGCKQGWQDRILRVC